MERTSSVRGQEDQDAHDASVGDELPGSALSQPQADLLLRTDMALIKDKSFKKYAQKYAKSEEEFFKE